MDLFAQIARLTEEGRPFVLATVIDTQGSTPQKPGSRLVVLDDGSTLGTVGGGAIEHQIVRAARALFDGADSTQLIETHLTHDLGMCCGGKMKVFLEKHGGAPKLWVFGAGHVAKELAALAKRAGFRVSVFDARAEWATRARFPDVDEVLCRDPVEAARAVPEGDDCYHCVVTHDHPLDQACVEALMPKRSAYLGVIGSRRKAERFRLRLQAAGFSAEQIARLRSPMGADIGALTPAEIAVSIVAELVAVRRQTRSTRAP